MNLTTLFHQDSIFLMEGALGERLKREYNATFDDNIAMAGLIYETDTRTALKEIWTGYAGIAAHYGLPFLTTTPTRRANLDRVNLSKFEGSVIRENMSFLLEVKKSFPGVAFAGGLMGCKGDAYRATEVLSIDEAKIFHSWQAEEFSAAGADFLYAGIMPALPEAIGMAQAMASTGLPYIISFMIRSDGRLIDGTTIHKAIRSIDEQAGRVPLCYMTNCVHPIILRQALSHFCNQTQLVRKRFRGIQANASLLSPEELDNSIELHASSPVELAESLLSLQDCMNLTIAGGCCGTDDSHIEEIAKRITLL